MMNYAFLMNEAIDTELYAKVIYKACFGEYTKAYFIRIMPRKDK